MIFKYGSYTHTINTVELVRLRKFNRRSNRNRRRSVITELHIRGYIAGASQAAITSALQSLETAYGSDVTDAGLYLDDGTTPTAHVLTANNSYSGIEMVSLEYNESTGEQYATQRTFDVVMRVENDAIESQIEAWEETVRGIGICGPTYDWFVPTVGPAIRRQATTHSLQTIIQQGYAVGIQGFPDGAIPDALYPELEDKDQRQLTRTSPQSYRSLDRDFLMRWTYVMRSNTPMSLVPNNR